MVPDGSKSTSKLGAAWAIADEQGTSLTKGNNPDFGNITTMHSHREEIFGLLAAFIFLDEYCRFFGLTLNSEVRYYCDNQEVVNKLIGLRGNNKRYDKLIRTTDYDAILALKIILLPKLKIDHVKVHADRKTKKNQLTILEQLNIQADLLC